MVYLELANNIRRNIQDALGKVDLDSQEELHDILQHIDTLAQQIENYSKDNTNIEIEVCKNTPSYCALEAVQKFIMDNYKNRFWKDYEYEKTIEVQSGRIMYIRELQNYSLSLRCKFIVSMLN